MEGRLKKIIEMKKDILMHKDPDQWSLDPTFEANVHLLAQKVRDKLIVYAKLCLENDPKKEITEKEMEQAIHFYILQCKN